MEYPFRIDGQTSSDGLALTVYPPDPLVREAAGLLVHGSVVADIGAGRFQNAFFLAEEGHLVHAIDKNPEYVADAEKMSAAIGASALSCRPEAGNIVELTLLDEVYDAVVATRMLHEVTPETSEDILRTMRRITKPGGLHILRAYVGNPSERAVLSHLNLFEPGDLRARYAEDGWLIEKASSDIRPLHYTEGGARCSSTDELVARKPFSAVSM